MRKSPALRRCICGEYVPGLSPVSSTFISGEQRKKCHKSWRHFERARNRRSAIQAGVESAVNEGATLEPRFSTPEVASGRSWLPLMVAVVLVAAVVTTALVMSGRKPTTELAASTAGGDPYAASLPMSNVVMSESSNLAGGKVTYIDGQIENIGGRTVTGIIVQVLFRNSAHETAQNQTLPMTLIRTREPYIDTEPVSAAPLKPGARQDFRLIFDAVSPDWAGDTPEIRILHVDSAT